MMKRGKSKVNLHDSSKRQENNIDLVDRISALPDDILGRILSILPTEQAVATSILSKQWKNVWRKIHNLDFCHDCYWNRNGQIEYENMKFQIMRCWNGQIDAENMKFQFLRCWNEQTEAENTKFVRFVDRVLLLHNGGLLTKFSLVWGTCCVESQASSWINTAITRNVSELSLCLVSRIGWYEKDLSLPKSVFICDSLRSLELKGGICVSTKIAVFLPRLERLKLDALTFKSEEGFENLISECPMLKYLYIHLDSMDVFTCIVSSASLKHLEIRSEFMCNLELNAPSLEHLEIIGWMHEISVQNSLRSLFEADFRFAPYYFSYDSIVEGIRAFDCAKALTFSAYVMQALSCATISLSTEFTRLVELETEIFCCDCSPLRDFIQSSDSLEVLTIHQHSRDKDRDYLVSKPLKVPRCLSHPKWTSPTEVPRCLLYTLKKVVIDGYKGYEDERETVRYMLEHGSVLEVVKISCCGFPRENRKLKLLKEICKFPRKSPVCEVEFF